MLKTTRSSPDYSHHGIQGKRDSKQNTSLMSNNPSRGFTKKMNLGKCSNSYDKHTKYMLTNNNSVILNTLNNYYLG